MCHSLKSIVNRQASYQHEAHNLVICWAGHGRMCCSGCVPTLDWVEGRRWHLLWEVNDKNEPAMKGQGAGHSQRMLSNIKLSTEKRNFWLPTPPNSATLLSLQGSPQALVSKLPRNHLSLLHTHQLLNQCYQIWKCPSHSQFHFLPSCHYTSNRILMVLLHSHIITTHADPTYRWLHAKISD